PLAVGPVLAHDVAGREAPRARRPVDLGEPRHLGGRHLDPELAPAARAAAMTLEARAGLDVDGEGLHAPHDSRWPCSAACGDARSGSSWPHGSVDRSSAPSTSLRSLRMSEPRLSARAPGERVGGAAALA